MSDLLPWRGLVDEQAGREKFIKIGLSDAAAGVQAQLLAQSARVLADRSDVCGDQAYTCYVPGRIEVLGKHTDYGGGRSITAATQSGFSLLAVPRADAILHITAGDGDTSAFTIDSDLAPPLGHWSNYPMTVARRLARNFPGPFVGADIAFAGSLPAAAGISSSSAMMIAFYLALEKINQLRQRDEYQVNIDSVLALAGYLGTVENGQTFGSLIGDRGVGTFGGSEDHTAILCSEPNRLNLYSYCPARFDRFLPMPDGFTFAIASSGVIAEKTGAALERYNRASQLASAAAEIWRRHSGRDDAHLAAAIAASPDAPEQIRSIFPQYDHARFSPADLARRFEHFYAESEQIIPEAAQSLERQRLDEFGRQVDRSQKLAELLLGNQVPETCFLAARARQLGATAASAFGAGFGGSVWALVEQEQAEAFLQDWSGQYRGAHAEAASRAVFFLTQPGPAAAQVV